MPLNGFLLHFVLAARLKHSLESDLAASPVFFMGNRILGENNQVGSDQESFPSASYIS
jgi:hypothetical protein